IGLAGRGRRHIADRRHAGAGTALASRAAGSSSRTAFAGRAGAAGGTFAFAGAARGTLIALRARRLAGPAGHGAHTGRARIALAGRHEFLARRLGLGLAERRCLGAARLFGLAAFFFLTRGFLADLPAAIVFLDAARLFSGETLAVLGLTGAGQGQGLTPRLGFGRAQAERRPVLLLHRPALTGATALAGTRTTGTSAAACAHIGLGHDAGALFHDHRRARRSARHPAGAVAQASAALEGQRL